MSVVELKDDNWGDLKNNGPYGSVGDIGVINSTPCELISDGFVGKEDPVDFIAFSLNNSAVFSFSVAADDALSFTVYTLVPKTDKKKITTYSLKSLQSSVLKLDKQSGTYIIDTKDLLLASGTYYIGIKSTNVVKGGHADYSVSLNPSSTIFINSNDQDNDWLYDKKSKLLNTTGIDNAGIDDKIAVENWVGFGDTTDYFSFDLSYNARLSFDVISSDAAKFTVWSVTVSYDKKGDIAYTVKALQSSTLKLDKTTGKYTVSTKKLLLEDKENVSYYFSVESTNAAKGGNANYSVSLNTSSKIFINSNDDPDNNWLYDSKTKTLNIKENNITSAGSDKSIAADGWVGFGDAADYYSFDLSNSAKLSFDVTSTDAAKFTVWSVTVSYDKKGDIVYTVKALQSSTLKLDKTTGKYTVSTKELLLEDKENVSYYFSVGSTNAAKGGNAKYCVASSYNILPINLTIGGISNEAFDDVEDPEDCCLDWDNYGEFDYDDLINTHYQNHIPKAAFFDAITGTQGDDTVTFSADKSRLMRGGIDLGDGNDTIVWKDIPKSSPEDSETDLVYGATPENGSVNMGDGDNYIYIGTNQHVSFYDFKFGDGNDVFTISGEIELWSDEGIIDMGNGNNQLILNKDSYIDWAGEINFGDGNDEMTLASGADIEFSGGYDGILDFGDGNDKLIIQSEAYISGCGQLDFGDGNDSIVLNGCLCLGEDYFTEITDLENISGNGAVIVSESGIDICCDFLDKCETVGIKIINTLDMLWDDCSPAEARADDTVSGARVLDEEKDDIDIWLCGQKKADSVEYGFADPVDYIKVINNDGESKFRVYADLDVMTIEIKDASEKWQTLTMTDFDDNGNISLNNGTYYFRFTIADNACSSATIEGWSW